MKKIKIFVPPGIGDSIWSITKIPDMRRKLNPESVEVIVQNTDFNRSEDFLLHFNFIDSVSHQDFDLQPMPKYVHNVFGYTTPKPTDSNGFMIYLESTGNFMGDPDSWLLIPNGHLERGHRLETWFPEFETEMDIAKHWIWRDEELEWAKQVQENELHSQPFIVFCMGPLTGNTISSHNRDGQWTLRDWYEVGKSIPCPILMIGCKDDDWQYANLFLGSLSPSERQKYHNLCGETKIGQCFALIKRSQLLLSYPCGIGIFSAWMGHPTSIFFRQHGDSLSSEYFMTYTEDFSHCWCPLEFIDKSYFPSIYGKQTSTSVLKIIERFL